LLGVDDAQWLDRASERALSFAVRRLPPGISLLLTRRSERVVPLPLGVDDALTASSVERIEVGPLSIAALHHVIRTEIGAAPSRPMLVRVASASGGNPFFALEIARMLSHGGPDVVGDAPLPISDRLHELVNARVADLSESSREVLLAVAALSRPSEAVLAASFGSDAARLALAEARDSGVITAYGVALEFTHPLLASAVYTSASHEQRRRVHQRLAETVLDLEERAKHLANAATAPDEATALEVERGADLAASRGAQDEAADLFGAAVRLTPPDEPQRATRRRMGRSAALLSAGDPRGARTVAESALELATDSHDLAEALLLLCEIAWVESPGRQPIEYAENALRHAGDDRRLRGRIHAKLAEYSLVDHARVLMHSDVAADLLDENDDPALLASALLNNAFFSAQLGHGARHDLVERAFRLEERAGPDVERNRVGLIWLTCMDETEAARARHRIEDEWYRDRGEDGWRAERLAHLALAEFYAGEWQVAEEEIEESCAAIEQMGQPAGPWGMTFYMRSLIDLHQGRIERARPTLNALREELDQVGHPFFSAIVLSAIGTLEALFGEPRAAISAFGLMRGHLDEIRAVDPIGLRTDPDEIDALVAVGEPDGARAVLEQLERRHATIARPWTAAALPRARAVVLAAEGDPAAALQAFDSLDVGMAERVPLEHARTLLTKGQLHRRLKQRRIAGEVLGEALERFVRLGAVTWEQRARAELARTGVRRPAPGELTASELRVAELAAAGLTNREVAKAAFMSPKTVEANLARIYRKLGIRSRAELGARMEARPSQRSEELQA
jgi:DNA-binding NarL/FixJ family response regulator